MRDEHGQSTWGINFKMFKIKKLKINFVIVNIIFVLLTGMAAVIITSYVIISTTTLSTRILEISVNFKFLCCIIDCCYSQHYNVDFTITKNIALLLFFGCLKIVHKIYNAFVVKITTTFLSVYLLHYCHWQK